MQRTNILPELQSEIHDTSQEFQDQVIKEIKKAGSISRYPDADIKVSG